MLKVVRNTFFTAMALILTSVGLAWNKETAATHVPVLSEQSVLAAQDTTDAKLAFPLTVTLATPAVRLGQYQEVTVTTVPDASLEIVTTYPNGSTANAQTLSASANQSGQYQLRFKLSDFHSLGLFTTTVTAHSGGKTARVSSRFVLQTWAGDLPSSNANGYVYPLVP